MLYWFKHIYFITGIQTTYTQ